ncbi:hypothetical protein Hte_007742 [Hypoxylon texense]
MPPKRRLHAAKGYEEELRLTNIKMAEYRTTGEDYNDWSAEDISDTYKQWGRAFPRVPGKSIIFNPDTVPFGDDEFEVYQRAELSSKANYRAGLVKRYFDEPQYKFQKVLGAGGAGLNLHFKWEGQNPPVDFVVKTSLQTWAHAPLRHEIRMTRKMRRAAHCIQSIEPHELDRYPEALMREPLPWDDSSDEADSSGDESIDVPTRPAPVPRRLRSANEQAARDQVLQDRRNQPNNAGNGPKPPKRKDILLLEYAPGGNLEALVGQFQQANNKQAFALMIPNRILWSIWLCLVRACVAMKYPPRKFHPYRPRPPQPTPNPTPEEAEAYRRSMDTYSRLRGELIETVPPPERRFRAKNIVHFDIDPSNIFLDDTETKWPSPDRLPGEHFTVPLFKLADFGFAEEMKPNKRNKYYVNRRSCGKRGQPYSTDVTNKRKQSIDGRIQEQFGADWEKVGVDPDGPEVSEDSVAGSYGSPTNVWGIAMTMWCVITQRDPPEPPQPQIPAHIQIPALPAGMTIDQWLDQYDQQQSQLTGVPQKTPISYCLWMADGGPDGFFQYVDADLRRILYECMYHRPEDRFSVERLLELALLGASKSFPNESDKFIQEWVDKYIYSAPTN